MRDFGEGEIRTAQEDVAVTTTVRATTTRPPRNTLTDLADFGEFVQASLPGLLRYGHALTGDPHDAADLVQSVLEKIGARWSRVRGKTVDPLAYVRRSMAKAHISRWRRTRRENLVADLPDATLVADEDSFEHEPLWQALRDLPPRQRAVIVLRYHEGLSEVEMARALNVSQGRVKSQAGKAIASLRRKMAEGRDEEMTAGEEELDGELRRLFGDARLDVRNREGAEVAVMAGARRIRRRRAALATAGGALTAVLLVAGGLALTDLRSTPGEVALPTATNLALSARPAQAQIRQCGIGARRGNGARRGVARPGRHAAGRRVEPDNVDAPADVDRFTVAQPGSADVGPRARTEGLRHTQARYVVPGREGDRDARRCGHATDELHHVSAQRRHVSSLQRVHLPDRRGSSGSPPTKRALRRARPAPRWRNCKPSTAISRRARRPTSRRPGRVGATCSTSMTRTW